MAKYDPKTVTAIRSGGGAVGTGPVVGFRGPDGQRVTRTADGSYVDAGDQNPTLDARAYAPPEQQFFGGSYYDTEDYQSRQAELSGLQNQMSGLAQQRLALMQQITDARKAGNTALADQLGQQYNALVQNIQGLQGQIDAQSARISEKKGLHDQTKDVAYLAEQAKTQNQSAPVADFYGGRTQVDLGNADTARAQQGQLIATLQSDMAGNQPSLAALQLKAGADESVANQQALAASGGPMNAAFAQRNAALAGAATMQNLNREQAMLRAREYETARTQLGGALKDARGADVQMTQFDYNNALQQAMLEAQQRGLNAQQTQFFVDAYMKEQARRKEAEMRYTETEASNKLRAEEIAAGVHATDVAGANASEANRQRGEAQGWEKTKDIIAGGAQLYGGYMGGTKMTGGAGGAGGNPATAGYGGGENSLYGGKNYWNQNNDFGY